MHTTKVTTPKALQTKQQKERTNNGVGESFRVLYYGSASAGSVPFMWESQPGTPKHALTKSSLPPLTPPPSYQQFNQRYNSSMQVINRQSSKRSGFFRNIFPDSSQRRNTVPPPPSSLLSSSVSSPSSSSHSWRSTPMSKMEVRRAITGVKFGLEDDCGEAEDAGDGGSPTSTLCFGGEFKKSYRIRNMKKAMVSFVRNGRA